jgi:hypothetical protein
MTSQEAHSMSALGGKGDIGERRVNVRFGS